MPGQDSRRRRAGIADAGGLGGRPLVFPAPERFAAAMRGLFKPTDHKRRRIGGSPARHAGVVNGSPAMIAVIGDRVVSVLVLETRDGRIAHACGVSAPARLGRAMWARREHDAPLIEAR